MNHCQNVLKMQSIITQKISEYSIIRHCHVMILLCVRAHVCHQQSFLHVNCVIGAAVADIRFGFVCPMHEGAQSPGIQIVAFRRTHTLTVSACGRTDCF